MSGFALPKFVDGLITPIGACSLEIALIDVRYQEKIDCMRFSFADEFSHERICRCVKEYWRVLTDCGTV